MVNVMFGGIFCTSTVIISEKALSRSPRTIVTRPVAWGKAFLMPLGTSGNWTMVVGGSELSTCTVGARCPECTRRRKRSTFEFEERLALASRSVGKVLAFAGDAAAAVIPTHMVVMSNRASSSEPLREILRKSCIAFLLEYWRGLSIGHSLWARM